MNRLLHYNFIIEHKMHIILSFDKNEQSGLSLEKFWVQSAVLKRNFLPPTHLSTHPSNQDYNFFNKKENFNFLVQQRCGSVQFKLYLFGPFIFTNVKL